MIYFDNAATTYPKPAFVREAAAHAIGHYGGNPGRSGHELSLQSARVIFTARERAAELFAAEVENVAFTLNCTHALNLAIKGLLQNGGHVITSSLEHNSVIRPIHALSLQGKIRYSIAEVAYDDAQTLENFEALITSDTRAIICTIASNVTGQILPFRRIAKLCAAHNLCFIADGSQACGMIPLGLDDGINILCTAGHKGLYGLMGTGMLITDGKYPLQSIIEGGTGSNSVDLLQPQFYPDLLESGTPNTPGIASLAAGMQFIKRHSFEKRYAFENALCVELLRGLSAINGVRALQRSPQATYTPIVAFNIGSIPSAEAAELLNKAGFALRGGFHCAYLAHKTLGTLDAGVIRFSPSAFNTQDEIAMFLRAVKKIAVNSL